MIDSQSEYICLLQTFVDCARSPDEVNLNAHRNAVAVESTTPAFQSPLTRNKRTSLSPYQPATGRDPYGLQNTPAKEKRRLLKVELEGGRAMYDTTLLEAFFPNPTESQAILDALADKYGVVDRPTAKGLNGRRGRDNLKRG